MVQSRTRLPRQSAWLIQVSSIKLKRKRREAAAARIAIGIEELIQTNEPVVQRLGRLSSADMKLRGEEAPDLFVSNILTKTNLDILEALKKDQNLISRFRQAEQEEHQKMSMMLVPV